ncbi:CHAD domain-containing protein [Gayadomonas joobiniege]|uniref:CHAD domain-containing protein n=1 Tax=Gayadomonas joobiniege TaxID=1234606 RepID=UPI00035F5640|nr:CHAD domain-containing protein [Gayadomonas joobiniege]
MRWLIKTDSVIHFLQETLQKSAKLSAFRADLNSEESHQISFFDDFEDHIFKQKACLIKQDDSFYWISPEQTHHLLPQLPKFAHHIEDEDIAEQLNKVVGARKLGLQKNILVTRQQWVLRDNEGKVILRLTATCDSQHCLLTATALRGYEKQARSFAKQMPTDNEITEIAPDYHLLLAHSGFTPTTYSLSLKFNLTADMPPEQAVHQYAYTYFNLARENEAGILAHNDDIEFLHDYRVAIRKIRGLISLFKKQLPKTLISELQQELAFLAKKTNELRDLDVYLHNKKSFFNRLDTNHQKGLEQLFSAFEARQRGCRRELKSWLSSQNYQQKVDHIYHLISCLLQIDSQQSIQPCLQKLLRKNYKKVLATGQSIHAKSPDEEVHELRLSCKKLRYLTEYMQQLPAAQAASQIQKKLKKLQNSLGDFNDNSVQQNKLRQFAENAPATAAQAAIMLAETYASEQKSVRKKIQKQFAEFAKADTQQLVKQLSQA